MSDSDYDRYKRILELWEQGESKEGIARLTGFPRYAVAQCLQEYRSVAQLNEALGLGKGDAVADRVYFNNQRQKRARSYTDDELREAVKISFSVAETLRKLKLKPAGGNYELINQKIRELQLDITHFRGSNWSKGLKHGYGIKIPMHEILVEKSSYAATSSLKTRLLNEGYLTHHCVSCGMSEWLNQPIPLELDHINGNRQDNRLENLRLLCPNCHALTPTYRGKNMKVSGK